LVGPEVLTLQPALAQESSPQLEQDVFPSLVHPAVVRMERGDKDTYSSSNRQQHIDSFHSFHFLSPFWWAFFSALTL
jgi:hypothetical protein